LEKGDAPSLEELVADIERRDAYDAGRAIAPLRKADDAVEIDTTNMTIAQVVDAVCEEARRRMPSVQPERWPICGMVKGPLDTMLWRIAYSFLPTIWRLIFRMRVSGVENIPLTGPVVLASNHRSNLDPFFLGVSSPRQIHFMAKAELWKVKFLGKIITALGAFPVSRGSADRQAVRTALTLLERGALLGLFPEGHRHRDGTLGPINPGVTLFSLREGVVTVPVVMTGTERVFRRGLLRFPKVTVTFGRPLDIPPADMSRAQRAETTGARLSEALTNLSKAAV
jgi:1-acyl-sn-glycerol-3-phosphate acyltransferase